MTDGWTRIQQAAGTLAALDTLAVLVFTWLPLQQVEGPGEYRNRF